MPCKFYINVWIFVRENACKFCLNACGNIWGINEHSYYSNMQECKQLSIGCSALAGVVQTAAEASKLLAVSGPLAELQTAAERQLGFASGGSLSWATSRIANSCRSRDSWVLQAALSAGSLAELQTAASRQLGSQGAL
jgi:hypothetical protein